MYLSCGGVLNFMASSMALHANACKRPWYLLPLFVSFSQNFCEARACNGREVTTTASSSFTSQRTVLCSSPLSRKEWSAFAHCFLKEKEITPLKRRKRVYLRIRRFPFTIGAWGCFRVWCRCMVHRDVETFLGNHFRPEGFQREVSQVQ